MKKISMFIMILMGLPVIIANLLNFSVFNFATGQVDSWIMFWGSYLGAIVGASAVYFVAQLQIKKQHEQQIEAIRIENIHSTQREMKKFYLTNRLEKIEEMLILLEKVSSINIKLNNDLVTFSVVMDDLKRHKGSGREEENKDRIYNLRNQYSTFHAELMEYTLRLIVLSNYIDGIDDRVSELQNIITNLLGEVRGCFYSDEIYKKYLLVEDEANFSSVNFRRLHTEIINLDVYVLQVKLKETINEINDYI